MKKRIITGSIIGAVLLSILAGVFVLGLAPRLWHLNKEFVGLNSSEIQEKYGDFDCVSRTPDTDGLYKNASCSYFVTEARTGFFGTKPPYQFTIVFDENGVALDYHYEEGGTGG